MPSASAPCATQRSRPRRLPPLHASVQAAVLHHLDRDALADLFLARIEGLASRVALRDAWGRPAADGCLHRLVTEHCGNRLRDALAATQQLTAHAARDLGRYQEEMGPSQRAMLAYDAALWDARESASAVATMTLRRWLPRAETVTHLDLSAFLVTSDLLAGVRALPALRVLTLANTCSLEDPEAPRTSARLADTVRPLARLTALSLAALSGQAPWVAGTAFAVGEPAVLAATVRARPSLTRLSAHGLDADAWDDVLAAPSPHRLLPELLHLCATCSDAPNMHEVTLTFAAACMLPPPPRWHSPPDDPRAWRWRRTSPTAGAACGAPVTAPRTL